MNIHRPALRPVLLASALAALAYAPTASAAPYNWTGADAGAWNTVGNWSTSPVPTLSDDITILGPLNVAGALTIDFDANNSAQSLNFTNTAATSITNTTSGSDKTLTLGSGGITTGAGAVQLGANVLNQAVNIELGAAQTWNVGAGGLTVTNFIGGLGTGITKTGAGNLTINTGASNSFTGGLNANGGTVTLDFVNLTTPTNLIAATNALQINKGTLTITGKNVAAATTAQTFAGTTLGGGLNTVNIAKGASATSATLNLGALTVGSGSSAIFSPTTAWTTTASTTERVFISAGGSVPTLPSGADTAFFNAGVFHRVAGGAAGTLRLAAVNSSGQLLAKNSLNLAVGTGVDPTNSYQFGAAANMQLTNTGASVYSLVLNATSSGVSILVANSGTLTLNSVIQIKAAEAVTIAAGTGVSNVVIGAEKNLVLAVDNNAGLTISAPIANNGSIGGTGGTASAVTIVAGLGTGGVTLSGNNTYSGVTTVDGTLVTTSRTVLAVNHNNALGTTDGGTVLIGGLAASGDGARITLGSGVTVTGETLTIRTGGVGNRSTLTHASNATSAWNGNVVVDANEGFGQIFANGTTGVMTIGASAANTLILNGPQTLRGTGAGTVNSTISGAGNLGKTDAGSWTLTAANTYTGATSIVSTGVLSLANSNPLGTTPGVNGTSGISIGVGSVLQSATAGANPSTTIAAPITLVAGGNTTLRIGQGATSNTHTFNINGAIGGATTTLVFTTTTGSFGNGISQFVLGAASNYTGNTTITTGNGGNNPVTVRNGVANALPVTTVLTFAQVDGGGSGRNFEYNLNGNNQTLAGLDNGGVVPQVRTMRVTSTAAAELTINNTSNYTFGGSTISTSVGTVGSLTRAQITGAIALTKSGTGTFTLGGTLAGGASAGGNTFTGATKILGGILVLGESLSIQNSAFDTANSIVGGASDGLRAGIGGTGVTTLTLGGLTGGNDFSTRFTSTTGGYTNLTNLTLNPGTGAIPSYAGDVGNGNGSMTLTKSGLGTQTLTVAQTYSGGTNINAGTLALSGTGTLGTSGTALTLGGGSLDLGTLSRTVGAVSVTAAAASGDTISNGSLTGTSYAASHTTGTAIISANLLVNGGAGFALSGAGSVTLSGNNTYSGGTSVTSTGVLNLAHSNAAGSNTINLSSTQGGTGTTFTLSGDIDVANDIQIDAATGRESIVSLSGSNTLSGDITINNDAANFIVFNNNAAAGTTFTVGGAVPNSTTITGSTYSSTISFRANTASTQLGVINSQINVPNAIVDVNNFGNWTINSTGNNWGTTQLTAGGILKLGANDALDTGAYLNVSTAATSSGYLDLNGKNQQVAGLVGGNTTTPTVHIKNTGAADSTLTLAGLTANRSFSGIIADGDTNKISLVLNNGNAFIQTLTGANTYTGDTTVSGGILAVNGSLTGPGTTTVTSATLKGSGLITGPVTIGTGGTLAPGNSIESLGGGALTLNNGSTFEQEIQNADPILGADLFYSSGTLSLSGTVTLNLINIADPYAWQPNDKVTLISYTGTPSLLSKFKYAPAPGGDLDEGDVFDYDGAQWSFKYEDTTPGENYKTDALLTGTKFVTMTVVPEAGTAGLLALGLLLLLRLRRR